MTLEDIDIAIEKLLKDKSRRKALDIDKKEAYELRHRRNVASKLETLFNAGYLKLNTDGSTHQTPGQQ